MTARLTNDATLDDIADLQLQITHLKTGLDKDRRDRFAMAALAGFCANTALIDKDEHELAGFSSATADALIAELDKGEK